jgi:hypothetical protein
VKVVPSWAGKLVSIRRRQVDDNDYTDRHRDQRQKGDDPALHRCSIGQSARLGKVFRCRAWLPIQGCWRETADVEGSRSVRSRGGSV